MDGRQGGHVSQCGAVCEEKNAEMPGVQALEGGCENRCLLCAVMDSFVQGMRNERMEGWAVCLLGSEVMENHLWCMHQ